MEDDRRRDIALFRYSLVREAADPELSPAERGRLVRRLAAREHVGPGGKRVRVGRSTLDRWIRLWRAGGYDALVPTARARTPQIPPVVLETAERLRREQPARTAAHIVEILAVDEMVVSARTLQRHFVRAGLHRKAPARRAYGRFEAVTVNEIWTGDAMHGRFKSPAHTSRSCSRFSMTTRGWSLAGNGRSPRTPSGPARTCKTVCVRGSTNQRTRL